MRAADPVAAREIGKRAGLARDKLELELMVYLVQQQCLRLEGKEVPAWVVPILERDEAAYEEALRESSTLR